MKQIQFVKENTQRWQAFEALCNNENEAPPANFAVEYRKICNDLAIARTRHYSPSLVDKLNDFVRLGQGQLYQKSGVSFGSLLQLFRTTFMAGLYENRYYLWLALAAFWGLALFSFGWVMIEPEAVNYFLDPMSVKNIEAMYDPAGSVQGSERTVGNDVEMFGVYIYNNIGIAFQMFGGGALLCIGAVVPLLFNSFYFGAISAHIVLLGYQDTFFSFVITHGSFELTAVIIAGAAGCKIGYAIINPQQFTRAYALKQAGKSVLPLIVGAFLMLVLAAFIEAFWSPLDIPSFFKYVAGTFCWALVIWGLYRGTRYGHY